MGEAKRQIAIAALTGVVLAIAMPVRAAGDFFTLPLDDAADRVLRAVGCVLPENLDRMVKCSDLAGNGIPETTDINIWGARPAGAELDPHGKPSKAMPPYVFMSWQDSLGGPFLPPHAERREAEEMLRQVLLTIGVLNDGPVVKAFFAKVGPNEDKVTPISVDGLKVFVEVKNTPFKTGRGIFVGAAGFKMPQ